MNASFEDCRILDELLDKHGDDLESCFSEYTNTRKPNGDGLQELSAHNFIVMRDKPRMINFCCRKNREEVLRFIS